MGESLCSAIFYNSFFLGCPIMYFEDTSVYNKDVTSLLEF